MEVWLDEPLVVCQGEDGAPVCVFVTVFPSILHFPSPFLLMWSITIHLLPRKYLLSKKLNKENQ